MGVEERAMWESGREGAGHMIHVENHGEMPHDGRKVGRATKHVGMWTGGPCVAELGGFGNSWQSDQFPRIGLLTTPEHSGSRSLGRFWAGAMFRLLCT